MWRGANQRIISLGVNQTDGSHCASFVAPAKAGVQGGRLGFGCSGFPLSRERRKKGSGINCQQAVAKKEHIVRYSAKDLLAGKRERGETRSDWARAAAMTEEEIESDVAFDPNEAGMVVDWDTMSIKLPEAKADLHMRIDRDVLDFFRETGRGYQTRINAVLRSYVERARRG
jgi:uncharacterized protein (DUF4415 family)